MKKLLIIAMLLLPFALFAQTDSADKKPKEQYCMVLATSKFFSNKVSISVDFGQENKLFSDQRLKDEAGKVMNFNSVIDALNYMAVQGWEFVNAYAVTVSSQNVYHYVLRRKVS